MEKNLIIKLGSLVIGGIIAAVTILGILIKLG